MAVLKSYTTNQIRAKLTKQAQVSRAVIEFCQLLKRHCKSLDDVVGYNLSKSWLYSQCESVLIQYESYDLTWQDYEQSIARIRVNVLAWTNKRSSSPNDYKWVSIMSLNIADIHFYPNTLQDDVKCLISTSDIAKHLRGWF